MCFHVPCDGGAGEVRAVAAERAGGEEGAGPGAGAFGHGGTGRHAARAHADRGHPPRAARLAPQRLPRRARLALRPGARQPSSFCVCHLGLLCRTRPSARCAATGFVVRDSPSGQVRANRPPSVSLTWVCRVQKFRGVLWIGLTS